MENDSKRFGSNFLSRFNWALFIGLCVVAVSIFFSADLIAGRLPQSLHGSFHGSLSAPSATEAGDFLSTWEAASFLRMDYHSFTVLLESGELEGTYTLFEVERREAIWWDSPTVWSPQGQAVEVAVPVRELEFEYFMEDHRIFSRKKLTEWLNERINN